MQLKKRVGRPRKNPAAPRKTSIAIAGDRWAALRHLAIERHTTATALLIEAIDHILQTNKGR